MDNEFLNWTPENVLYLNKEHQILMDDNYDEYGDHYTEFATVESLRSALDRVEIDVYNFHIFFFFHSIISYCFVQEDDLINTHSDTFLEFKKELFDGEPCFKVFQKCKAYFDDLNLVNF